MDSFDRKKIFLMITDSDLVKSAGWLDDLEEAYNKSEIKKFVDKTFPSLSSDSKKEKEALEKKIQEEGKKTDLPPKEKSRLQKFKDLLFHSSDSESSKLLEDEKEETALHSSGTRDVKNLKWIVLHSTESDSASGTVKYFQSPKSTGSAHFVVGEDGTYRTLPDEAQPWGAPGANAEGLHIEIVGHAKFTREEWEERKKTLENVKRIVSNWSSKYNIPLKFVDADGLKAGNSGVTTHAEVSKAFHKSTHWDPGPNFPMDKIL